MYNHDGTTDFLKMLTGVGFIILAVWWIAGVVGDVYALLIVGAIALVIVFAGGAMFAHMNQKQTFDAITKFNANDAQIDRYRLQSFKAQAQGDAAMQKAAAQLTVLDAKRVDKLATQQAKLLTGTERMSWQAKQDAQQPAPADTWTWDDDGAGDDSDFQEWR